MHIDTHGHVNFNAFKEDSREVLDRALENETWVVMPGSQYSTSKRATELAAEYEEGVYAAVGIHPIHLGEEREVDVMEVESEGKEKEEWMTFKTREESFDKEAYRELARREKVVAIGEIGLDYYRLPKNKTKRRELKELQKEVLKEQIDLALELDLPCIFHCRVAHEDIFELISGKQEESGGKLRGVMHSYTGDEEQARRFLDLGMFIGFNGLIFKEVPALPDPAEVISSVPLDRLVVETDAPYLTPPQAETERNEPVFVKHVAERVSEVKGISPEEGAEATARNAKRLFSL